MAGHLFAGRASAGEEIGVDRTEIRANEPIASASVLAKELGERQISVNAVAPGLVNTTLFTDGKTEQQIQGFIQRTPLGRLGEPEDIANVVSALVSADAAWVSGQVVYANGAVV